LPRKTGVAKARGVRCICGMRSIFRFLVVLVFAGLAVESHAQGRPQFRPAVLGSGPDTLINRIDSTDLLKKEQKDGAVMFCCVVEKTGQSSSCWTYRGTPGSEALEQEVKKRLEGVKFTPPIYEHQPVSVLLSGTVIFSPIESPHVRILLNQDPKEIKEGNDFIAPQPVIGADSHFTGLHEPTSGSGSGSATDGLVAMRLTVDAKGGLKDLGVEREEPADGPFGQQAQKDFTDAKFIPAFRFGVAEESTSLSAVCYKPRPPAKP
jgi:hypothetical protein